MAAEETQCSVVQQTADLQEAHEASVVANLVRPDSRWAKPCRAYNLHILPSARAREDLIGVQTQLTSMEPGLLAVPTDSLHVSVAWLLAVHADYGAMKDDLWAECGKDWTAELAAIAAETPPFSLRYERVVATDSAIIVLASPASPASPVNDIRQRIRSRVELPPQTRNTADLVHTTLCRYQRELNDPARLLATVGETRMQVRTEVSELIISQERVYPSLDTQVLAHLPLQGRAATAI